MQEKNLRQLARKLAKSVNEELLRLGNILVAISDARLYNAWGFSNWGDYLAEEIGMGQPAAWRIMTLSRWARVMDLTVAQRTRLGRLGRYKAVYVTRLCKTKGKIDHWLTIAENNTLRHLKRELLGGSLDDIPASFGVWLDGAQRRSVTEAIDLAYETSEYELSKGALLARVCDDYLKRWKKSRKGTAAMN